MRDELQAVLDAVQVEITRSYSDALTDGDKNGRLRDYIEKCVLDGGYSVWGSTYFLAPPGETTVQIHCSEFSTPEPTVKAYIREAFI